MSAAHGQWEVRWSWAVAVVLGYYLPLISPEMTTHSASLPCWVRSRPRTLIIVLSHKYHSNQPTFLSCLLRKSRHQDCYPGWLLGRFQLTVCFCPLLARSPHTATRYLNANVMCQHFAPNPLMPLDRAHKTLCFQTFTIGSLILSDSSGSPRSLYSFQHDTLCLRLVSSQCPRHCPLLLQPYCRLPVIWPDFKHYCISNQ